MSNKILISCGNTPNFKIGNEPLHPLEIIVSENKHLCTVYKIPGNEPQKNKPAEPASSLLFSFKNIMIKKAKDWLADLWNCTKTKMSTNNLT
ncbi:hypothetical protein H8E88_26250 [candidate division KSB1 bacterium]|nr:hypothetical protein [candidate division KSB1 bacterium]